MKQTAINWLDEELYNLLNLYPSEWEKVNKLIKQAKEMHKQEIINAFETAKNIPQSCLCYDETHNEKSAEEYYIETFNNNL